MIFLILEVASKVTRNILICQNRLGLVLTNHDLHEDGVIELFFVEAAQNVNGGVVLCIL